MIGIPSMPYFLSGLSVVIAILGWLNSRRGNKLLKDQLDQQAEEIRQQGERVKQQGRARFIEKYYPPLIQNLKDSVISVKEAFKLGHVGGFDVFFDKLLQMDVEGTLGMIKPLSDKIYNGLKRVVEHYIPALNSLQVNQIAANKEIPKKWIILLIEKDEEFPITITEKQFVSECHFIWDLWRNQFIEAKKGFDEVCKRNLNSEDNTEFLRDRIFWEIVEEADNLWLPVQNGFNTLYKEMHDWIGVQAVVPMEESLAEITEGLRASSTASIQ